MRRVVVTGMGGITPYGSDWARIGAALRSGRSAVRVMPEWDGFTELQTRLGVPVDDFRAPAHYPRKALRAMGRVAQMSVRATELALEDAGLLGDPALSDGRTGIAYGSSFGSVAPVLALGRMMQTGRLREITSTSYIQLMSHTAAVNIGLFFGLKGRVVTSSSACTSGSQALGYAFEAIRYGRQELMVAGGSEELSSFHAAVFDTLFATSTRNDSPEATPRPFDRDRDGLVVGEGAVTLVLEERERALARGATIHAEILGFGTNADGAHVTHPAQETMAVVMEQALADAGLPASEIAWVSAHGTATEQGDIAESHATRRVFGRAVPTASLKGHVGHTLGACGALEAWWGIAGTRDGWLPPTLNLAHPDPRCAELDYLMGEGRPPAGPVFMSNNFAFGGINTSLILRV